MKISKVEIENFRCFETYDATYESIQALIGANASGKTAILEAINFATSRDYSTRKIDEQCFNNKDTGDIKIRVYFDDFFISHYFDGPSRKRLLCKGVYLGVKRRKKSSPNKSLSENMTIEHLVIPVEYDNLKEIDNSKLPNNIKKYTFPNSVKRGEGGNFEINRDDTNTSLSYQNLVFSNDLVGFPSVFYFDRSRELEAKMGYNSLFEKISRELNWRYLSTANKTSTITDWEKYYNDAVNLVIDPKKTNILNPIREDAEKILGDKFENLEISLLYLEEPFKQSFFSIREPGSMNQIEFSHFGSGVSTLIAYLLLKQISILSKEEVIFLIDEPEIHLHPQAQILLYEEFLSSSYQVIFTTHSESFVDIKNWSSIQRIDRDHDTFPLASTLIENVEGKSLKDHLDEIGLWHQDKTIYLKENNSLFFAKKIVLVEGAIDEYALKRLGRLKSLNLNKLTIINCDSKNKLPNYQLLCKAFSIPYFTLFDMDGNPETSPENKKILSWSDTTNYFGFSTDLEEILGVPSSGNHKGSKAIEIIDKIVNVSEINTEVNEAIDKIIAWSSS